MTIYSKNNPNLATPSAFGATALPQWGVIFVEGPDAASFLQNQLSNSVLGLERTFSPYIAHGAGAVRLVGYCNPKGRLLASAWLTLVPVSEGAEDRFALFISKDIAPAIAKRLSMYVLRSKVKVVDASQEWHVSGVYGDNGEIASPDLCPNGFGLRMPDVTLGIQNYGRIVLAEPVDSSNRLELNEGAFNQWNYLEVVSAIPRIVQATQEQFVPQMINFESVAGVDFKKGCYPGQEIVARSQYRGVIKRRLQLANASASPAILDVFSPGVEIFHSRDFSQPAGMIVLSAVNPGELTQVALQVECKIESLEAGELHVHGPDGPILQIDPLPYPLIEI